MKQAQYFTIRAVTRINIIVITLICFKTYYFPWY